MSADLDDFTISSDDDNPGVPESAAAPLTLGTDDRLRALEQQLEAAKQWEGRFKGLQNTVQQRSEEAKQLREYSGVLENQLAETRLAFLPEEQREPTRVAWEAQRTTNHMQAQRAEEQKLVNTLIYEHIVSTLAQQYKVPQEKLRKINDPYAMEAFAQEYSELRKNDRADRSKQERKSTFADAFESSGSVNVNVKAPETYEEAAELLAAGMAQLARQRR